MAYGPLSDTDLRQRWAQTWRALAGERDAGAAVFDELATRYNETHRAYHNLNHIADCLITLESAAHLVERPVEVEAAVWFHDAVYDTRRADNEAQSAVLAERLLGRSGVASPVVARIAELIRITTHERHDLTGDAAVLCDVDLAILAGPPERFAAYDAAIRVEYDWVPEAAYRAGRGRVLARFLERPRIYQTDYFYSRLEDAARANLKQAIERYRA